MKKKEKTKRYSGLMLMNKVRKTYRVCDVMFTKNEMIVNFSTPIA